MRELFVEREDLVPIGVVVIGGVGMDGTDCCLDLEGAGLVAL